ncbi:MAG: sialate O-acetylesterase [Akkermansiaceae bacterium]
MKTSTTKTILAPLLAATLLLGMSSTYAATYDWSTATASAGAGTPLNSTTNGDISGANDGWYNNSTIDDVFAVNDSQPAGFSGNYATIGSSSGQGVRDNDGNFGYSISSTATEVTLSSVLNVSSDTGLAWMGLADSTGGEQDFRIGFFGGNWVYRDNDGTIVSMADTGVSAVGAVAKSYRVTAVFDLVANTYDYTVENLTDGGSIVLADDVAVDSSVQNLDWSVYDGLRIRGDDASFDSFSVSFIPPEAFTTTYDFSTATGSASPGTALATNGANDNWSGTGSVNFNVISNNQPAGFSGNYVSVGGTDYNTSRLNDSAFSYSIASDETEVTLSAVMHFDGTSGSWGWAGLKDISNGSGNAQFRIGYFGGNWVYRDNASTIVSHTPTGDAVVAGASQSFRVTAVFDLVGDTYSYTVENLSLGTPGVVLASGAAVTTDVANLDWSTYDGLYMRGRNVSFDTFTVTSIPEPSEPRLINVFFAGGQSNATAAWADAITAELVADPAYDNVVMVHSYHPGNWLQTWYTTGVQANYETDFFNASQTGVLEAQLAAITAAGDTYVISGFFWFQGEGDTGSTEAADLYESRFMAMLNQIKTDAGLDYDIPFTLAVIDANPDDPPAGRTWEQINYLRNIQQNELAVAANNGTSVDTRGYARTDAWHLTTEAKQSLGAVMAQQHIATFNPPTDVFFMGGQSNADIEVALGIEDILRKSGHFNNPTVVWNNHPGNPVIDWHDGSVATKFFDEDLYDLDGIHDVDGSQVGLLEQVMTTGTPKRFRAFFWWQGESDSSAALYPLYEAKFMGLLGELETRLGQSIGTGEDDWSFHFALPDIRTFAYDDIRDVQIGIVNDNSATATYTDTRWLDRLWGFSNPHGAEPSGYFIGVEMANDFLILKGLPAVDLSAAAGETLIMPDENGLTALSGRLNIDKYPSIDGFLNRASTWPSHVLPQASTILRFDNTLSSPKAYAVGGASYNFANSPAGQEGVFPIDGIEYASPHQVTIQPVTRYYNSMSFGASGVDASAATSTLVINCDVETREPQVWVTATGQDILFDGPRPGTIVDLDQSPIGSVPDGELQARRYAKVDLKNATLTGGGAFEMRHGTFDLGSQANTAEIIFGFSDITFADAKDGGIASPFGTATDLRNTATDIRNGWERHSSFTYNGANNASWNRNIYIYFDPDLDTVSVERNVTFAVSQAGVTFSSTGSFGPKDTTDTDTLNLTLGGAGNLSISGAGGVLGNGSALCNLEKTGSGTLTLSSSGNTFNGALEITSGKLLVNASSSVNSCSDITVGSGSTTAIFEYASTAGLNRAVTVHPGSTFIYSSLAPCTGALTVLPGAVVIVDGALDITNLNIPTGARLVLRGNASLSAGMSLTVDGTLDTITWLGTLPGSFVNNGLLLDHSTLKLDSSTFTVSNAALTIHGYPGHGYQLQTSTTLLPDSWSFIGNSEDGTDALITFDGPIEPEDPGTFYRILVNP